MTRDSGILAIDGGNAIRNTPLPSVNDASGHIFNDEEINLVLETLKSGRLNYTCGNRVTTLENNFADYFEVSHCIASSSGTASIHIAVGAIGIEPGDEVIVPPITDIGTVIGILYQNATPVFADVDPETFTIDPEDVARKVTEHTRAIIPVHLLGNACEMDGILQIAREHDLVIIEDVAQAYLTQYKGKLVGTIGSLGCFSLQQSKHMTAGDGGLTITNDNELAKRCKLFSDKGWDRPLYKDVLFLAPNYRMTELQAAVAIAQLSKLKEDVNLRRRLAHELTEYLTDLPGIIPPIVRKDVSHSYWEYAILLDRKSIDIPVDIFGKALSAEGIPCLPGYTQLPMYLYPIFQNRRFYGNSVCPYGCKPYGREVFFRPGLCPNAEQILKDIIVIPWNARYSLEDVKDIGSAIRKVTHRFTIYH